MIAPTDLDCLARGLETETAVRVRFADSPDTWLEGWVVSIDPPDEFTFDWGSPGPVRYATGDVIDTELVAS